MDDARDVFVVDDDADVRDSLQFLLSSAGFRAIAYGSAESFLAEIKNGAVGCLITDVRMPKMSGIDLIRELRSRAPDLSIIVITGHGDVPLAVEAMKLGAVDFFEKPFSDDELLSSVAVALSQNEAGRRKSMEHEGINAKLSALSIREREVLEGLVRGKPNKIIAFDLGISPRTVEIYRANVMRKMEANSLSDLVRMAITADVLKGD